MFYSYYSLLALVAVLWLVFRYVQRTRMKDRVHPPVDSKSSAPVSENEDALAAYQNIEPLSDFDWASTPPIKIRPFKPKYHLTMALETIPLSSLLEMDHTYLSRIKLRRELMSAHPKSTLACNPVAEPAALELYSWLMNTYLPKRFPTCYELITQKEKDSSDPSSQGNPTHLLNKITSEPIPLHPASPLAALHTISAHIDTDFLILLPKDRPQTTTTTDQQPPSQSDQPQQEIYHLQAFATTFPSGFSTLSKLSLPLSSIHAPVPSYGPKLQKSMDRFFASLPAGKLVRRANWTITTTPALFTESGTHIHSAEEAREAAQGQREELDVEEMRLRCERQTLHRLPGSGALVFAFKTYLYGLGEVKKEGSGEALAEATEGFKRGSVPEMEVYKRAVVWGEVVRGFLRS